MSDEAKQAILQEIEALRQENKQLRSVLSIVKLCLKADYEYNTDLIDRLYENAGPRTHKEANKPQ